ncbi:MAG: adenosylcobinamide-GDP ribazoletransferase, partial [Clostridia bacterium]
PLLIAFALSFLIMMGISARISRFLHGLTGDIYGAMTELGEAIFLLMLFLCTVILSRCGIMMNLF